MRTEKTAQTVELGDMVENENGEMEFVPNSQTEEVITTDIYADEGKVFRRKSDGAILSGHITVGTVDSVENYEEVDNI